MQFQRQLFTLGILAIGLLTAASCIATTNVIPTNANVWSTNGTTGVGGGNTNSPTTLVDGSLSGQIGGKTHYH